MTIVVLELNKKKESDDKTKYSTFYSTSKEATDESDIDDLFKSFYGTIAWNIPKDMEKVQVELLIQL